MKRVLSILLVALLAFTVAADAYARAGKSGSMGSRGSRTYDRPMERSVTPPPATAPQTQPGTAQPMYNPGAVQRPAMAPQAMQRPGFFQRNPMLGGLMAGMVGAGLFGLLFNSSAFAAAGDAAPFA
ncbi:MAG TPA: hypothetical protein VLL76_12135, partial [Candidatus Omnitrophota bacterium]|nr:hypothetical protein [Candidatus Omnitrophota bacterium]